MVTERDTRPPQLKEEGSSSYLKFRTWVLQTFSDRFMAELAILLIPTTLLPLLFTFSEVSLLIFRVVNLVIVVLFILEYVLKLLISRPRWKYAVEFVHIVDLVIILLAVIDFLPFLPLKGWRASPLLRLLRVVRIFFLTGRAAGRVTPAAEADEGGQAGGSRMRLTIGTEAKAAREASLEDAQRAMADREEHWISIDGLTQGDVKGLSHLLSIPGHILESKLLQDNFPGIDNFGGYSIITLWDTKFICPPENSPVPAVDNPRLVIIRAGRDILTLSQGPASFADRLGEQRRMFSSESLGTQILLAILKLKIDDYKSVLISLEKKVAGLEHLALERRTSGFLETAFQLKKVIQTQGYNISHFVRVLDQLVKKEPGLQEWSGEANQSLISFHSDARALNDLFRAISDNTTALIELQLNKVSFGLNRVMRILAVITCLALVPTIIGGLLGQNLKDQPYDITIHEIFFFVFSLMLLGLYVFYRKGWLK
jgi:magnesium transporter